MEAVHNISASWNRSLDHTQMFLLTQQLMERLKRIVKLPHRLRPVQSSKVSMSRASCSAGKGYTQNVMHCSALISCFTCSQYGFTSLLWPLSPEPIFLARKWVQCLLMRVLFILLHISSHQYDINVFLGKLMFIKKQETRHTNSTYRRIQYKWKETYYYRTCYHEGQNMTCISFKSKVKPIMKASVLLYTAGIKTCFIPAEVIDLVRIS